MYPLKIFPENNFRAMVKEIGPWNYHIYDKNELIPGLRALKSTLDFARSNSVVAGTGCTIADYRVLPGNGYAGPEIIIPGGSPIMVVRQLRYDDRHGDPHYNADDQLFFPIMSGKILRMHRRDAPDHYIKIAKNANVISIADAYKLPDQKSGPVEQYSAKGAKLYIEVIPLDGKKKQDKRDLL